MGRRGKERAKQTKVAREIKYQSPPTDLTALRQELGNGQRRDDSRVLDQDADLPVGDESAS